jgi:hypothetical protein
MAVAALDGTVVVALDLAAAVGTYSSVTAQRILRCFQLYLMLAP